MSMLRNGLAAVVFLGAVAWAAAAFSPPRYQSGSVPPLPAMVVGGGEVLLELTVGADGRVGAVTPLRITSPFTQLVADAVQRWQFVPAAADGAPVPSKVLVAAVYRPPALQSPTLGQPPSDITRPSDEIPFPLALDAPPFPPFARSSGVVLVEARVDTRGAVADAIAVLAASPFDDAAAAAIRTWKFRPARVGGVPVESIAYIIFGFPVPVASAPASPPVD